MIHSRYVRKTKIYINIVGCVYHFSFGNGIYLSAALTAPSSVEKNNHAAVGAIGNHKSNLSQKEHELKLDSKSKTREYTLIAEYTTLN